MSLFNYFQREVKETDTSKVCDSMKEKLPESITQKELECIQNNLMQQVDTKKKKRSVYEEKDKQDIAKYAAQFGTTAAIRKFKHRFPNLNESTVRPWLKRYKENLKEKKKAKNDNIALKIGQTRGRPLLLDAELDLKLRSMIVSLRRAGAGINIHVVRGVLMGLVQSNPEKFGKYVNFDVSRSWVRSLYQRMKFSRRAATTSRPVITRSLWIEVKSQFLHDISEKVLLYNIPDELIINADQTPSKYVATDNITMAAKGEKHISRAGSSDKRSITLTLCESHDGIILPFQLIYKGKTARSLPKVDFPEGFCLSHNEKHWSNETETIRLIDDVLVPYIEKVKEEKALPRNQKSLLIWDAFKAQSTTKVEATLASYGIETVMVPKNMTHLLQPLDLTTNGSLKKFENKAFSEYFCSSIMKELKNDPTCDVTTIKVDLRLSTLKPLHAGVMKNAYDYFASCKGKEIIKAGWKAAGITDAIHGTRSQRANIIDLNPFT